MPAISSRTPEGDPLRCPLCGEVSLEMSLPLGDAPCPNCGQLLWMFRDGEEAWLMDSRDVPEKVRKVLELLREQLGLDLAHYRNSDEIPKFANDLGADSLDTVELVMDLEEEFDVNIPDDAAERFQTIGDLIRYMIRKSLEEPPTE